MKIFWDADDDDERKRNCENFVTKQHVQTNCHCQPPSSPNSGVWPSSHNVVLFSRWCLMMIWLVIRLHWTFDQVYRVRVCVRVCERRRWIPSLFSTVSCVLPLPHHLCRFRASEPYIFGVVFYANAPNEHIFKITRFAFACCGALVLV